MQNNCNGRSTDRNSHIPGFHANIVVPQLLQVVQLYIMVVKVVYTVEPPITDTPNNGHLPYNGQQSMYQQLFP